MLAYDSHTWLRIGARMKSRSWRAMHTRSAFAWRIAAATCIFFSVARNALAHSPIEGIGTFYAYALHPLVVLPHALLLVGTSLFLGQQSRIAARAGIAGMAIGFLAVLAAVPQGMAPGNAEALVLSGAGFAGILAAWAPKLRAVLAATLCIVAGSFVGLDSFPKEAPSGEAVLALAGLAFGFLVVLVTLTGISLRAGKGWQQLALRVLGAWIAATSLLPLSLHLAGKSAGSI
jgi:urease accessory protein